MFSESTPQRALPRELHRSLYLFFTSIIRDKKTWQDLNFTFFAALDTPFNTHHFNVLTESLYTTLHCINHLNCHQPNGINVLLRCTNIPHDVNWIHRSICQG